jgi:hypothetical protein
MPEKQKYLHEGNEVDGAPLEFTTIGAPPDSVDVAASQDLGMIPEVRHVIVERFVDSYLVWVALDNPDREVREKVFDKQLGLLERFPEVDFDFNLIPAMGRSANEISTSGSVVFSRPSAS